jgi:hypothetical protein
MKNKLMLLGTFFIVAQTTLPITSSAEGMYQDWMRYVTSVSHDTYYEQLSRTKYALSLTRKLKFKTEFKLFETYEISLAEHIFSLTTSMMAGLLSVEGITLYCMPKGDIHHLVILGIALPAVLLVLSRSSNIYRYALQKQIKEYTEVSEKLILKCSELKKKISDGEAKTANAING